MMQTTLQDRVVQFHDEVVGGTDAADGIYRTTTHGTVFRHDGLTEVVLNQIDGMAQAAYRAVWVQRVLPVLGYPRAQDQRVPVFGHVMQQPGLAARWFGADLFGQRYAVRLQLAVSVVGGEANLVARLVRKNQH